MSTLDTAEFRKALGSFVTGVTIVTTRTAGDQDVGLTANSFNSVSLDPPLVLWSLARSAGSREAFEQAEHFAVHVLASDQETLSNRFARRGEDKFAGLALDRGACGTPLLRDCAARFECRTVYRYEGGDHIIFVGQVQAFEHSIKRPLAFHAGRYAVPAQRLPAPSEPQISSNDGSFSQDFLGNLLGRAHWQFYTGLRPQLQRHGLSEPEHYVLGVLCNGDGRRVPDVNLILADTGIGVTPALIQALVARELIAVVEDTGEPRLWLTPRGRQLVVELTAAAKAVEADTEQHFNDDDLRVLKQLLKHMISGNPANHRMWDV